MAALPRTVVRDFAFTFCTHRVNFLALFHLHYVAPFSGEFLGCCACRSIPQRGSSPRFTGSFVPGCLVEGSQFLPGHALYPPPRAAERPPIPPHRVQWHDRRQPAARHACCSLGSPLSMPPLRAWANACQRLWLSPRGSGAAVQPMDQSAPSRLHRHLSVSRVWSPDRSRKRHTKCWLSRRAESPYRNPARCNRCDKPYLDFRQEPFICVFSIQLFSYISMHAYSLLKISFRINALKNTI